MQTLAIRLFITGAGMLVLLAASVQAREPRPYPSISIIIDDIGYRNGADQRALELPGPVAYAIMPSAPFAGRMLDLAARNGKEVLVHLPMEAMEARHNRFLGPGALTTGMSQEEFLRTVETNLRSVPGAIGVNNHMGSLLTRQPAQMGWLMDSLKVHDKFYVDSVTSNRSIAGTVAMLKAVPSLSRDVFLDNHHDARDIQLQFDKLISVARRKGRAIAIGHPHPETIAVLNRRLRELGADGVTQLSLRQMLATPGALEGSAQTAWVR